MSKLNLFWCGSILNHLGQKNVKGEAPAASQWSSGLLNGLLENNVQINVFAPIWDSFFPKGQLLPTNVNYLDARFQQQVIKYINLPYLRNKTLAYSLENKIRIEIKGGLKPDVILNYNPFPHYCEALKNIKKKYPEILWINVVLDLYNPLTDNWRKFLYYTEGSSGSVFLSWWGYCNAPVKNKLHLDGGWAGQLPNTIYSEPRTFLYAGKIADYAGLDDIIEGIKLCNTQNIYFDFYGKGHHQKLNELSAKDKRVRIRGFVSDEDLHIACCKATAFLNPRDIDFHGTPMIFPSKIFTYLKYKKPILSPPLPGFSPDYKHVLITVDGSDPANWSGSINYVLQLSTLISKDIAINMSNLLEQKKWKTQASRLIEFIETIKQI